MSENVEILLRLRGSRQFVSETLRAVAAENKLGDAAERSGRKADTASRSNNRFSDSMRRMRQASLVGASALGVAGAAAVALGVRFNATMEQQRVAFTQFLGSGEAAQRMLDQLFQLSARTPFEFSELTSAAQRMMGFGLAAEKVVPLMSAVGDAVAAAGGGAEQIERISRALGQIQARGKISAEELLQLSESGIPAQKILQEELGLTGEEVAKIGTLGITAERGLAALQRGMAKRYKGMAAAQAKTFSGMVSTLRDSFAQMMGKAMMPLFLMLRNQVLPALNESMPALQAIAVVVGVTLGGALIATTRTLAFFSNHWEDILNVLGIVGPLITAITARLIALKVATLATAVATNAVAAATWAWNAAIVVSPIGWVIAGVTALVAAFVLLYRKNETARRVMTAAWEVMKLTVGVLVRWIADRFRQLARFITSVVEKIKTVASTAKRVYDGTTGVFGNVMGVVPGLASGGTMTASGVAMVGERGPELLSLPRGASVFPAAEVAPLSAPPSLEPPRQIITKVYLQNRQIAEAVAGYTDDRRARR